MSSTSMIRRWDDTEMRWDGEARGVMRCMMVHIGWYATRMRMRHGDAYDVRRAPCTVEPWSSGCMRARGDERGRDVGRGPRRRA